MPKPAADAAKYYDRVIDIDLSALEPHINGPFTPDAAHTISDFGAVVREKGYPRQMEVGLIGSCTNSSYQDLSRAASVARQAKAKGLKAKAKLIINPGSEQVRQTAERDGLLDDLLAIGGTVMTNACGRASASGTAMRKTTSVRTRSSRRSTATSPSGPTAIRTRMLSSHRPSWSSR